VRSSVASALSRNRSASSCARSPVASHDSVSPAASGMRPVPVEKHCLAVHLARRRSRRSPRVRSGTRARPVRSSHPPTGAGTRRRVRVRTRMAGSCSALSCSARSAISRQRSALVNAAKGRDRAAHALARRSSHSPPPAQPESHRFRWRACRKLPCDARPVSPAAGGSMRARSASGRRLTSSSARANIESACRSA